MTELEKIQSWKGFKKFDPESPSTLIKHPEGSYDSECGKHSALIEAIKLVDFSSVQYLIGIGADVNERNGLPLLYALCESSVDIIELLIENDANVNLQNDFRFEGYTAYTFFLNYGLNYDQVRGCIPKVKQANSNEYRDLYELVEYKIIKEEELYQLLYERFTNYSVVDDEQNTVLHLAVLNSLGSWEKDFHIKVFEDVLYNDQVDVNTVNEVGNTSLHQFLESIRYNNDDAETDHIYIIKSLMIAGTNQSLKNANGEIIEDLCYAKNVVKYDTMCEELEQFFYPQYRHMLANIDPYDNSAPLVEAAYLGKEKRVEWLIRKGADPNQLSTINPYYLNEFNYNETYLDERGDDKHTLNKYYSEVTPLMVTNSKGVMSVLLNANVDIWIKDSMGENALMKWMRKDVPVNWTISSFCEDIAQKYSETYLEDYVNERNKKGQNALQIMTKNLKMNNPALLKELKSGNLSSNFFRYLTEHTKLTLMDKVRSAF